MAQRKYLVTEHPIEVISKTAERLRAFETNATRLDGFEWDLYAFYSEIIRRRWQFSTYGYRSLGLELSPEQIASEEAAMLINTELLMQHLELIQARVARDEIEDPLEEIQQLVREYKDTFDKLSLSLIIKEKAGLVAKGTAVLFATLGGMILGAMPGFIVGGILFLGIAATLLLATSTFPITAALAGVFVVGFMLMMVGAGLGAAWAFSPSFDYFFGKKDEGYPKEDNTKKMMSSIASLAVTFGMFSEEKQKRGRQTQFSDSENELSGNEDEELRILEL